MGRAIIINWRMNYNGIQILIINIFKIRKQIKQFIQRSNFAS